MNWNSFPEIAEVVHFPPVWEYTAVTGHGHLFMEKSLKTAYIVILCGNGIKNKSKNDKFWHRKKEEDST